MTGPFRSTLPLAMTALLSGCSADRPVPLPDEISLPTGLDESCDCIGVEGCHPSDAIAGQWQVRNLACHWLERNEVALCRYESRFIAFGAERTEPWTRRTIRARYLPDGRWCADEQS